MAYDAPPEPAAPPAQLAAWLRVRTRRLRQDSIRRRFPAELEIVAAVPPEPTAPPLASWVGAGQADDHGLRVEVLIRLLAAVSADGAANSERALIHVRPGPPELADSDFAWWSAARCTHGIAGVDVVRMVALTRWGWVDVASGAVKTWARLRT